MPMVMLMRPHHWVKNAFLFLPLFFSGEVFNITKLLDTCWGFFAFGFVASSIYILNDYMDLEADRKHPAKCNRPLAAGTVSKPAAILLFIGCLAAGTIIALLVKPKFAFVLGLYFLMNLAYSLGLKNISILDVLILSIGFVLRVKAGGVICVIPISQWLMIMIFLLAFFMAIAKRRDDTLLKMDSGVDMRKSIKGYNLEFLNVTLGLVAAVMIVAYLLYTISPDTMHRWQTYRLYYTTIFVIAGLLRYLQITLIENNTGSPTRLLYKDTFLQITLACWIVSFYTIIYLPDFSLFK
ncbi:prenyltransferase [Deminuibacter soli]|uniref:Prenyltransferase n=1 Tax=Deminuibacter soli TaxID=2291815 RepID=A0A3E1NRU1_9BACT|nr:prenyltransferase [Deminuibacter soli]